jgi:Tfp pilus assembly protein FimT
MKRISGKRKQSELGFSIVELLLVVAIMLVLSAITVPSVMQSLRIYRLNASATAVQNIMETARYTAIRRNKIVKLQAAVVRGQNALFVDAAGTGVYANTDPVYFLPADMTFAPAGAPAASTTGLANTQSLGASGCISFDQRGTVDYTTCGGGAPVVWFLSVGMAGSTSYYRGVTVSTMGQAKAWTGGNGGTWKVM